MVDKKSSHQKEQMISVANRQEVSLKNQYVKKMEEGEKRNPNSLRFLIAHIIELFFQGNRRKAADAMSKAPGRYVSERADRGPKRMNYDALIELLRDEKYITYWQLEQISWAVDIPVGALLLFSRWYALRQNDENFKCERLIKGIRLFADALEDVDKRGGFSQKDFKRFSDSFQGITDENLEFAFGRSPRKNPRG